MQEGLPSFVSSVVSILVTLVTTAAVIRMALDDEAGRSLSIPDALRFGVANMGKLALPVVGRHGSAAEQRACAGGGCGAVLGSGLRLR